MLEIEEYLILGVIHRALHGLVQNIEFGHTVVECPHILFQVSEHLLLDELIETGLIESVAFNTRILDKVIEESGEPQFVALVLAVRLHLLCTMDIQSIEAASQHLFIQYGIEEVELFHLLILQRERCIKFLDNPFQLVK